MIIDTHVHLDDDRYKESIDEVISKSVEMGVETFITMGIDYQSSINAIEIAKKYNNQIVNQQKIHCYAFVGVYPENVLKDDYSNSIEKLSWVKELVENNKDVVKGIGEIGIDLYWDKTHKEEQVEFFKKQLDFAYEYDLPVSIHAREATQVTYDILKEYKNKVSGVLHCYSGSVEMAKEFTKLGFKLGIGGTLTFKNSKLWEVIQELDLSCFVTETDGPYLAPTPHRGEMNIPGYIQYVIQRISEIKQLSYEETETILEENARKIFKL